jgi:hypothetical protein
MRCMKHLTHRLLVLCVATAAAAGCREAVSAPPPGESAAEKEIAALKADVQMLKDKAPSASVAMADVSFHWSNLWFAGQAGNWPLANYYFSEARNHVRWLIRINPMPKGPDGNPVDLQGIFEGIDKSAFADVKAAIDKKDKAQFATVYRTALESCYACHKAVGRLYLKPQIPTAPPQTIVNLDPNAAWPQ